MPAHSRTTRRPLAALVAVIVAFAVTVTAALALGGSATASDRTGTSSRGTVAHTVNGKLTSKVVGTASDGSKVSGSFTPLKFVQKDGKEWAKGVLERRRHLA